MQKNTEKMLDPQTLAAVRNFSLKARLIVDGFLIGRHRGPHHAFSHEYSRHRDYYPGDSLKLVDWKLFARSDRFFVREFQEETNLYCWLLVDISRSMSYSGQAGPVTKLEYASCLAAAFSYLLLQQKDMVGLILFDDRLRRVVKPSASSRQLNILLKELKAVKEGGVSDFCRTARLAASRIKKRGLVVLFSDLLEPIDQIEKTLKHFLHGGRELIVFHLLTPEEIHFPFKRFGFFEDLETRQKVLLQPNLLKAEYTRRMQEHLQALKALCRRIKVSYQLLETTRSYDSALAEFFKVRERMH
ncbi:MAG TPA: DUF58 domain-containing protein [Verrucomicrobiae bacterium]|nr:DUF58 domain-containing protein [Verrucomicrobiae bacterium]